MLFTCEQRVMWLANVRSLPFRERVETTAKADFGWLTTSPNDYDQILSSGLSANDMRNIAADNDVRLTYLDPLARWVPEWQPENASPEILTYIDRSPDDFFRIAEALRVDKIHLIGAFPEGRYATDYLVEQYAAICDRAAENGLGCTIEAIPFLGIKTLEDVWQIVSLADRPNGGIIFDTWHYIRGGRNDELLNSIPSGVIETVQLADGTLKTPPGRSDIEDCNFYRRPIGEGELPISEIVQMLRNAGHLNSVGPEIFSAELDTLDGEQIIKRIMPGFNRALDFSAHPLL